VVFADRCGRLVQEVFAGVGDTGVNLLDVGFRLLPVELSAQSFRLDSGEQLEGRVESADQKEQLSEHPQEAMGRSAVVAVLLRR
jgi:hypothetical protein